MRGLRAATTSRPACWRHGARFASTVSAAQRKLRDRMQRELGTLFSKPDLAAPKRSRRRMIDHVLPPYAACNYRTLRFIFVRTPRIKDFPRERNYRRESLDLLYRHFYKGK